MKAFRDPKMRRRAPYLEGAAIAIDSRTGGIRAIAGGRDYDRSKFNRALLGRRQIGSSVKPFVYAKAFEDGKPGDLVTTAAFMRARFPPPTAATIPQIRTIPIAASFLRAKASFFPATP